MLEKIISNLAQSGWTIVTLENNWISATNSALKRGLFLGDVEVMPGDFKSWTIKFAGIVKWDALIFCPKGINSSQLKKYNFPGVQLWYWDMQRGNLFPYPPTKNNEISLWLRQLAGGNPASLEQQRQTEKRFFPLLTYVLIGINIIVFLLMTLAGGTTNQSVLIAFGAKVNSLIKEGQVWRLLTSMFIHIGILHITFNMYALWAIGPLTERVFGHRRFFIIYILSGLGGSFASFLFTTALSAGASGAIFGLVGALLYYSYKRPSLWKSGLGINLVVIIVVNFIFGLTQPGIDNFAHLGGLLTGAVISVLLSGKIASASA
jgi:rhomboid protease GluP